MSSKRNRSQELFWSAIAAALILLIGYYAPKQQCAAPAEVRHGR